MRHGAGNNGLRTATSDDVVTAIRARGACATPASSGATSAPTASHTPTGDQLHTLGFIAAGENALFIGKPGTGKSHIAKAIGYQAILQSHKVQYIETDDFFHRYALSPVAQREVRLRNIIDCDLLVLDDLFLSRTIPDDAGALLQTLIHQRYKLHRSVIVTSNRVVQDWGAYLGDNTMSTTILDRLMHHCHLLEFDGRSYRLKQAAETLARETKSN